MDVETQAATCITKTSVKPRCNLLDDLLSKQVATVAFFCAPITWLTSCNRLNSLSPGALIFFMHQVCQDGQQIIGLLECHQDNDRRRQVDDRKGQINESEGGTEGDRWMTGRGR